MTPPSESELSRYEAGRLRFGEVTGPAGLRLMDELAEVAPDLSRFMAEFGYGDIYSRTHIGLRERQIATLAALTAVGDSARQLEVHVTAALRVGLTPTEIIEVILNCILFAGFVRVINAIAVVREVFASQGIDPNSTD